MNAFKNYDYPILAQQVCGKFDEYLESAKKITILAINDFSNSKEIFDDYFSSRPPFDLEKKKHEFPDAFMLQGILQKSLMDGELYYLISSDPDWLRFSNLNSSNLRCLEKLSSFTDLISCQDRHFREVFESLIRAKEPEIKNYLREILTNQFYFAENHDYEIADFKVDRVEIVDKNIINYNSESALCLLEGNYDLDFYFSYEDSMDGFYDREDQKFIFMGDTMRGSDSIELTYSIEIHLDFMESNVADAEISYSNLKIENVLDIDIDPCDMYHHED
jgi:hypothetical protein